MNALRGRAARRLPAWVVDGVVAGVAVAVIAVAISVANEPASRPLDPLAYALGAVTGGALVARRRWPVGVLATSFAALYLYYALGYPGFSPALALAVPLYTAAVAGRLRPALLVVAVLIGSEVIGRTLWGFREPPLPVLVDAARDLSFLVVVVLLADTVRSRRVLLAETRERLRLAAAEREQEARRRVTDERLRIARELHDVLAHTVAVITVQAGVAADVLDTAPAVARAALETIRSASREALGEVKAAVGVLRASDPTAPTLVPAPGLGQLDGLVDLAAHAGLRVEVVIEGTRRALPSAIDLTAYRIVQESLTNVLRHAQAGVAVVSITYAPTSLALEVRDDGHGAAGHTADGHGLTGMRERVGAFGGRFEVGPVVGGGFRVHAWLPTAAHNSNPARPSAEIS